jgi:Leucine-rich repeat (LRR) protein
MSVLNIQRRQIRFPVDGSMGKLYLRDVENPVEWHEYADARGAVSLPSDIEVRLCVSYEAMSDLSPLSALKADDLQVLEITCTSKFDDAQLRHIEHLRGLFGLALWETDTGDAAFQRLGLLSNLRWLDIGDTQITDAGLKFVRRLARLEELTLLNTRIGNDGLLHLESLRNLRRLDLMGTQVNDAGFDRLSRLRGLEYLRLLDTDISYPTYAELKRGLPDCRIRYRYAR